MIVAVVVAAGVVIYMMKFYTKDAVAVVNGNKITLSDLKIRISQYPEYVQTYAKQMPEQTLDDFIQEKLLLQKAGRYYPKYRKRIEQRIEEERKKLLVNEFLTDQVLNKADINQEQLKEYYNTHLNEFMIPERIHLYEIVVPTSEAAENILQRLKNSGSFSEIAAKESISESREKGGDLGVISKGQLMPEIETILYSMKNGDILGRVIKTDKGYHIIKVGEKMPSQMQTMEQATPAIKQVLITNQRKQLLTTYMNEIRNQSKITKFPERLKGL